MARRCFTLGLVFLAAVGVSCSDDSPGPTTPPVPPPVSASDLYAAETGVARVRLRWRDNSANESGFRIQRRAAGETDFTRLDSVAANVTSFEDRRVTNEQTFTYRIVAFRGPNEATPSNEVTVLATQKLPPAPPFDPVPADAAADISEIEDVVLQWTGRDPAGESLVYDVYFGSARRGIEKKSEGQAETRYTVPGPFERNAHYFWRVVARDRTGVSAPSPIWGFNTPVDRDTVPAGYFFMGDTLQYPDTTNLEIVNPLWHPGNPMKTDRTISIDRFLVNNQQYADFLNQMLERKRVWIDADQVYNDGRDTLWAVISPRDVDSDLSFSVADSSFLVADGRAQFPVVQVTWYGASIYAQFQQRRLPTEAEWEKAARGTADDLWGSRVYETGSEPIVVGLGYPYPWGAWNGEQDLNRANYRNSGDPYESAGRVRTTPVGYYDGSVRGGYVTGDGASPYGVLDMSGNVWEWTADWHAAYRVDGRPPTTGRSKVVRGGSFDKGYGSATTFNRSAIDPLTNDRTVGFRTVADVR